MQQEENISIFNFELDEIGQKHLNDIAVWAKINTVLAFASVGIAILQTVVLFTRLGNRNSFGGAISSELVSWVISILLNLLLLSASKNITAGLANTDQTIFNKGLSDLAKYLRVIGILCIIIGALFAIVVLIIMATGALGG